MTERSSLPPQQTALAATPAAANRRRQRRPAAAAVEEAAPAPQPAATIYDALRQAHALQRQLCSRLVRLSARKPALRVEVFQALKLELAAHAAAEERFLYVPMLMSDQGLDASRHALSEHHEIDELVEALDALAPDGEAWLTQARALAHEVRHHLKEEEGRFFQVSGKILTERQKTGGARQYQRDHDRMLRRLASA